MEKTIANAGEDDGSSNGESGGDSSSDSSGNSDTFTPSTAQAEDQHKRRNWQETIGATHTAHKYSKKFQSLPLTDVKPTKRDNTMTRGYGTLESTLSSDDSSTTSWTSNVKKWNLEAHQLLSPRANHQASSRMSLQFGSEDSSDDSETSTSSYSSSCSSDSPTIPIRPSSSSAVNRRDPQLAASKESCIAREELPLLHSYARDSDFESGILHDKRFGSNTHPDIRTEVRKLFELAYPVTCTYVLEFFPELVSMTLVGHLDSHLTKQYLDGVALSTMCMNLTAIGIGFGLATAMDTLCSQAYGAGKSKKLGIYLQSGLIVLGLAMIPVFVVNWYTESFLLMIGQPAQVAKFAGRFSRILLPGIPAVYVYEMVKKVMQAQNVVLPMVYIAVISNLVNLLLGVYLTFFTSLGFDGAAIARLVSEVVLPLCLVPYFMRHPHIPAEWWPGWQAKEAVRHVGIFLRLGLPGAAMMLLEWWSFEIMAAFVGLLPNSVVAISVHSVLVNVSTFAFNFFLGISVASNVLVGKYSGSNQPHHAQMASTLGMMLSVSLSAVIAVVIIATRYFIPEIFINDAVSIRMTGHALLFLMPYQMCDAINAVMQGIFRGTGRLVLGACINLFAYFVIGLPLGVYFAFRMDMGVEGMWLGLTAGIFSGCVVSLIKICGTDWKSMADAARVRTS